MWRTSAARCSTRTTSRQVTMSSTSSWVSRLSTSLRRQRKRSRVSRFWLACSSRTVGLRNSCLPRRGVDGDHGPPLAHHHRRAPGLHRHPLGGAVPGAGLGGGDGGVGDEVDVGPADHLAALVDDDRPVHLGQLGQPGRAEVGAVEVEAAAADGLDVGPVAEDDERPGVLAQDQLHGPPQRGPGGQRAEDVEGAVALGHSGRGYYAAPRLGARRAAAALQGAGGSPARTRARSMRSSPLPVGPTATFTPSRAASAARRSP